MTTREKIECVRVIRRRLEDSFSRIDRNTYIHYCGFDDESPNDEAKGFFELCECLKSYCNCWLQGLYAIKNNEKFQLEVINHD